MIINLIQISVNIPMFKDTNSKNSDIQKGENKANNANFFFIFERREFIQRRF